MLKENYVHPLTKHLIHKRGMTTRGWIRFNGLHLNNAIDAIYKGYYHPKTIKKLREDDLYKFLTEKVREKIEKAEKSKKENGHNV